MDITKIQDFIAAGTDLVTGKDLFCYSIPPKVSRCVTVLLDSSYAYVDPELADTFRNRFQIIVRDSDFQRGNDRAWEMFNLLKSEVPIDFVTYRANYVRPAHAPMHYRRSDSDEIEFSVNFDVRYVLTR